MENMNCSTFKKQLDESIENRTINDSSEFNHHKKECATCAQLLQSSQILDYAIDHWKKEEFSVDLVDRVLFHMNSTPEEASTSNPTINKKVDLISTSSYQRTQNKNSFATVLVVALVMISALVLIQSDRQDSQFDKIADFSEKNMELDEIIHDVGSAYLALANDTANSFSSVVSIVSSKERTEDNKQNNKVRNQNRWLKSLGNDLKPIQKDLGEAMDFLYESLPEDAPST